MRRLLHGTGHYSAWWPVLLLLLVVLVPSAGVLWMMRAAMDNERFAVRQRLVDAYHTQLEIVRHHIDAGWKQRLERMETLSTQLPSARVFAECVRKGIADSAVILDTEGRVVYPATISENALPDEPTDDAWVRARELEFSANSPADAARAYQAIADEATDSTIIARARQAEARARIRAGDRDGAIAALRRLLNYPSATDPQGRLLVADAELRLLQVLDANSEAGSAVVTNLAERLRSYDPPLMPSEQRRFLMHELKSLEPSAALEMLEAEDLAAEYVASLHDLPRVGVLLPTKLQDTSQIRSLSGRVVTLFMASTLTRELEKSLAEQPFPKGVAVAVRGPSQSDSASNELVAAVLSPTMPGWRLSLSLADDALFDATADERVAFFVWTAILVVVITAALALLAGGMLRRQLRLTRLKNDLVANVSHELKTPLASIRLLVDTLLDADGSPAGNSVHTRQYLEMISQENARLSRLIDNFLTFSRMERGKQRFDFKPTDAAEVIDRAVAAVAERFDGEATKLSVKVERPLPLVGDVDALVTVVVNLLDNAWKYTADAKQVIVSARRVNDHISIAVEDNGIGLSPRATRKIFDRFYQVDQRLSRSHGGCGLGLSIVKYVVEAHGGRVAVESQLGKGTTFTVSLPAAHMAPSGGPRPDVKASGESSASNVQHPMGAS